jgi:hypothetical protein
MGTLRFAHPTQIYFYGVRIHLISTPDGIPVEWVFLPGAANDVRGLQSLPLNLPPEAELYNDKGYTDYVAEDNLADAEDITLMAIRKQNSKRVDSPCLAYIKQATQHYIETVFSQITRRLPKSIHAVTFEGFMIKVSSFIWVHTCFDFYSVFEASEVHNDGLNPWCLGKVLYLTRQGNTVLVPQLFI